MEWVRVPSQLLQLAKNQLSRQGPGVIHTSPVLERFEDIVGQTVKGEQCALRYRQISLRDDMMDPFECVFSWFDRASHYILLRELWFAPEYLPEVDQQHIVVNQSHVDNAEGSIFIEFSGAKNCWLEVYPESQWRRVYFDGRTDGSEGFFLPGAYHTYQKGVIHRVVAQSPQDFSRHSLVIQLRKQVKK